MTAKDERRTKLHEERGRKRRKEGRKEPEIVKAQMEKSEGKES